MEQFDMQYAPNMATYSRDMIEYDADMTQTTLKIDPMQPGFKNNLSVASASALYNTQARKNFVAASMTAVKVKPVNLFFWVSYAGPSVMLQGKMDCQ